MAENGRSKVNWGMVAAVLTILGWLLAAASGVFGDYQNIGDRVTTLEVQRVEDKGRLERMDDKLDRILERIK